MCFAPQRRALFRHLNFQKWSDPSSVLSILTWKCASRHNGVHFFMSHLASWLRTRRFSEPTFRPSGATNHWKKTVNRDFPTFSRICIFFLLILSLLTLLTSAFSTVHIVGSFTSKLPSTSTTRAKERYCPPHPAPPATCMRVPRNVIAPPPPQTP